jgi:Caspase domain
MKKRYVAVGINDYTGFDPSGNSNLGSCVADAQGIQEMLVSAFGFDSAESKILTNKQATSANIRAALKSMLAKSEAGDVACFYYSGHGSRTPAAPAQADCDKFYESIIPASGPGITDRDLFQIADTLEPSNVNFTVILDSCHSGGMDQETDIQFKCRSPRLEDQLLERMTEFLRTLIPCGILIPPTSTVCSNNVGNATAENGRLNLDEDPDKVFVNQAKTTLIAGCSFSELSWETGGHGFLTKAFLDIVNASNFEITYLDILDKLRANVTKDFDNLILPSLSASDPHSQTPQLRGQRSRMEEGFLDGFIQSE